MRQSVLDPLGRIFRQPAFVVCAVVLAISGFGIQIVARQLQWHFRKLPIPLQKSFDEFDFGRLAPYRLIKTISIPEEIEEELGTKDYLNCQIEDTSASEKDAFRYAMLFITYYTGNPDKIPHVPDTCYVGSGGQVQNGENVSIRVPGCGAPNDVVPIRLLEIDVPGDFGHRKQVVLYFFSSNGKYCCTRNEVRDIQGNLKDRYSYFSKVEITFPGANSSNRQEHLAAAEKLARQLMPLVYRDHWPNWNALSAKDKNNP